MENIENFFQNNQNYFGIVLIIIGALITFGAYKDWNWILQGDGSVFNIAWLSKTFGRGTARILMGVLGVILIVSGGIWIFIF